MNRENDDGLVKLGVSCLTKRLWGDVSINSGAHTFILDPRMAAHIFSVEQSISGSTNLGPHLRRIWKRFDRELVLVCVF